VILQEAFGFVVEALRYGWKARKFIDSFSCSDDYMGRSEESASEEDSSMIYLKFIVFWSCWNFKSV
jgi:hypothetical protein